MLEENLNENLPFLQAESEKLIDKIYDTPYRIAIDSLTWKYTNEKLDKAYLVKLIQDTFSLMKGKIKFTGELNINLHFHNNQIIFPKVELFKFPTYGTEANTLYRINRGNLEYQCEAEFWENKEIFLSYQSISDFSCYNDIVIPESEFTKYRNRPHIVNYDDWLVYIQHLVSNMFPEFKFCSLDSTARFIRFKKYTYGGILYLEYDQRFIKSIIANGEIDLPNLYLRFLKGKNVDKVNLKNKKCEQIFLGNLGHPLFFPPCIKLLNYASVEVFRDVNNPDNLIPKKTREFYRLDNNKIEIEHSKEFGESLKKHAYFYMKTLSITSEPYLKFIERSI